MLRWGDIFQQTAPSSRVPCCFSRSHYNECALSLGKENCNLQMGKLKACQVPPRALPLPAHVSVSLRPGYAILHISPQLQYELKLS